MNPHRLHHILIGRRICITSRSPNQVLIESLLWIDGRYWLPYLVVFTIFLAPAGALAGLSLRLVGLAARVGSTYLLARAGCIGRSFAARRCRA